MSHVRDPRRRRTGCGLLILACAVTCLLLVINRALVTAFYELLVPAAMDVDRLRVIVQFVGAIVLLLPEWWLMDLIASRIRRLYNSNHVNGPV